MTAVVALLATPLGRALAGALGVMIAVLAIYHAGISHERRRCEAAAERARADSLAVDAEAERRQRQLETVRIQEEEAADAADRERIAELEREIAERDAAAPPAPECPDRGRVTDADRRRLLDVGAGARRPGAARPAR